MSITFDEKQLAKEIVVEMIKSGIVSRDEYPGSKTVAETIGKAYKELVKIISEDE